MALQNGIGQIQQYYANEFKRDQFNRMMDLYWAEHRAKYGDKKNTKIEGIPYIPAPRPQETPKTIIPGWGGWGSYITPSQQWAEDTLKKWGINR